MRQGKRFGLSAIEKSDLWRRCKAGQSLHEIGRAFGKSHSCIRCVVSLHGGFVPAVRRRSLLALTLPERAARGFRPERNLSSTDATVVRRRERCQVDDAG